MSIDKNKHQFRVRLRKANYEYLEDFKDNYNYASIGEALDQILQDYQLLSKIQWDLTYLSKTISRSVAETVLSELKKVRMGTNKVDTNTQVLIELVQGCMVATNNEIITTTDIYKPDFLEKAENVVKKRLEKTAIRTT